MTAERGGRWSPAQCRDQVRTQPGLQSPVSLGPIVSQQHPTTVSSENNMDLQIKENDDKEVGKVNYGTNFNNFIKVRE